MYKYFKNTCIVQTFTYVFTGGVSSRVKTPFAESRELRRLELREFKSSSAEKNASDWFSLDIEVVL